MLSPGALAAVVTVRLLQRSALVLTIVATMSATLLTTGIGARAHGAYDPAGFDFYVESSMGPIKSRIFRAADGNTNRVVYALDGMRAREDLNGWEIESDAARRLTEQNINVVMPIGGQSSFYADWERPSTFYGATIDAYADSAGLDEIPAFSDGPGKSYTYAWETFLTRDLRNALRDRLGFSPVRNGIFGLSMGGSAAITLAAYHPDQFSFTASMSGYLTPSSPGMRTAISTAMVNAGGYNLACMIDSPLSTKWQRMDPFVFAPRLIANNTRVWVSAATGVTTDRFDKDTLAGSALEILAWASTRTFQARMTTLGAKNVTYDFPTTGLHNWRLWQDELVRMLPDLSASIG
ncbi:alpha/beta hydrolase [Nocardia sp. NPDC057663]|uniref:alpha/beta hydrolase n=1 Tax=Nocardia sp. NPDC057663 TaxID=3346201 RepID=UPI00367285F2